jgi:hypothetical protein
MINKHDNAGDDQYSEKESNDDFHPFQIEAHYIIEKQRKTGGNNHQSEKAWYICLAYNIKEQACKKEYNHFFAI